MRTITIRVAEILEGGSKTDFYTDLRKSLDLARRVANKAVTLCVQADSELMTGGKCPKLYTYPMVASAFPGATEVASAITRAVENKYKQERWFVASGRKSICHYRSMPWVLKQVPISDNGEFLTARIKLLGGWWTVRLASGSAHRTQVAGIRAAVKICTSRIWIDRKHKAVLGLSVQLPPAQDRQASGTLCVATACDALLVATKARSDTPFVITGDEARAWISQRDKRYQRLRQDRKSGRSRQAISSLLRTVGDKHKRKMDSYTHEVASKIVAHAVRRNVATVSFDATVKSYLPSFPYFDLAAKIRYKCEDAGIHFLETTQAVCNPDIDKPHVYFKYNPGDGRVKIGRTGRSDGRRHGSETDSSQKLIILAVDNQPKTKLVAREKHWHAYFAEHRIYSDKEWFAGEPVIHWLRAAGWIGNAGNLSQIAQVLPAEVISLDEPPPGSSVSVPYGNDPTECSQEADNRRGYAESNQPALAVTE